MFAGPLTRNTPIRNALLKSCKTLLCLLSVACTDEARSVDAGCGQLVKLLVDDALNE